jgi:hypothetical protein
MKHLNTLFLLLLSLAIFSNCAKKTSETLTPTDTWHPTETKVNPDNVSIVSPNPPTTKAATFWIGPSTNHSFSIEAGSINLEGVYAINNSEKLEKDKMGNLLFYPKKSLADMEFFKSEIGNLDHEEGYLYHVKGTKYYLGTRLWGVIVTDVLQKVAVRDQSSIEEEVVAVGTVKTTTTNNKSQNSNSTKKQPEVEVMVSPDPPSIYEGIFWIGSSTNHVFSVEAGAISIQGAYAINLKDELKRTPSGDLVFYPTKSVSELEFYSSEIENLDYQPGHYYQVEGTLYYLGSKLSGVSVNRVLQKVKDKKYKNDGKNIAFGGTNTTVTTTTTTKSTKAKTPTTNPYRWQDSNTRKKQPEVEVMVSPDPPSIEEGIFWLGSSRNHSFSNEVGTVDIKGAYAINNNKALERNSSGEVIFYPKKSSSEIEFFDSKIDGFDYKEGYFYQIKGAKHYLGNRLAGISVTKVLQKIEDKNYSKNKNIKDFIPTEAVHPSVITDSGADKNGMVSSNPPSIEEGIFWIGSSRNLSFTNNTGAINVQDCYIINNTDELKKTPLGDLEFYNYSDMSAIEFYCEKIEGIDYEEGFHYKVKGSKYYLGNELTGISIDKVLKKVEDKDFTKVEEMIIFIGPDLVKSTSWSGQEIECYQVQYDTYSRSADWEVQCGLISGFEAEPGYMYKIKIQRTHLTKREIEMTADNSSYSDKLVSILRKRRM